MAERKLTLDSTLPRLREVFEEFKGVEVAILFGSMVRDGFSAHDIDLALKLEREDLLEVGWIVFQIAKALHVNEDRVDVTLLNHANPILLSKILRDGIVIKAQPEAIEKLLQRAQQAPDASIEFKQWATLDPKLDKAIIMSRVEEIKRNADFIRNEILCKRVEELNYKDTLALERAMHRIIEAMLDICRHMVSAYSLGFIESYGEYPEKLAKANKMPRDLAGKVAKLAGLRNILVHRYMEIKSEALYKAAKETVEEIVSEFMEWVKNIEANKPS
jgi:uncharacterized protein YutE (UPF0331/DUF86 family)/predicted nucleotidyltransferase